MKTLFVVSLLLVVLLVPTVAVAQRGEMAIPEGANLEKYPFFNHPLSNADQAKLGLHPVILDKPWTGFNWFNGRQRFVMETLRPKTIVLADRDGKPIYKADCGNRLVAVPICPKTVAAPLLTAPPAPPRRGFLDRLWDFVKDFWSLIGAIFLLLLGLLLLCAALYGLLEWLRRGSERYHQPAPPPTPPTQLRSTAGAAGTGAAAASAAAAPGADPASAPVPPAQAPSAPTTEKSGSEERKFFVCYFDENGEPNKWKFAGHREVVVEHTRDKGTVVTTVRTK